MAVIGSNASSRNSDWVLMVNVKKRSRPCSSSPCQKRTPYSTSGEASAGAARATNERFRYSRSVKV
ncbi:MAG: hypothetical protein B6D41_16690 [Chloroflexi bacterium UTCFX4]|nr:MAG: hypothetical protein B6D41_16690 [Chloroflexi bacterium UTCFX4]